MAERDWAEVARNLRAKAESTQFPAEAEALHARADALAAKYGIVERPQDDLDLQLEALQREFDAWKANLLRHIDQEQAKFEAHMAGQRAVAEQIRAQRRAGPQVWPTSTATHSGWVMTVNFG